MCSKNINEIQIKKVYDLLLTPIICEKNKSDEINIIKKPGLIISSQQYYSTPDEDMSDFALEFYKILYGNNLLSSKEVLEKGCLLNKELAGDTMNSFNTIANMFSNSFVWKGGSLTISMNPYLLNYKARYHCLANFWVIPMRHGRTSSKLVKKEMWSYDSPILYTYNLKCEWDNLIESDNISYPNDKNEYPNYFKMIEKDKFDNIHFLPKSDISTIKSLYEEKNAFELVNTSMQYIYDRARLICSNENIVKQLYERFEELNLID